MERPMAVWLGSTDGPELGLARRWLEERFDVRDAIDPTGVPSPPLLACLATDRPGRHSIASAIRLSRTWPLCRLFAVTTSLAEGRRRSGPVLPGVEDVPWHDLAGRVERWLSDLRDGRPGQLGMPPTSRREDRILGGMPTASPTRSRPRLALAAAQPDALEGLSGLLEAIGRPAAETTLGRPPMDLDAAALVWDCVGSISSEIRWLQVLAAQHPTMDIVMLESFPRGDRAIRAMHAGAACVLGRPTSAEVLAGTLRWLENRRARPAAG